jgi:hypothetical protein
VKFLGQVTQAAETRPQRLQQLTQRLTKVRPPVRQQFSTLTTIAGRRALQRRTGQSTDAVQRRPTRSSQTVSRIYSVDGTGTAGAADSSEPAASLR